MGRAAHIIFGGHHHGVILCGWIVFYPVLGLVMDDMQ
jgi:hypothetical protein